MSRPALRLIFSVVALAVAGAAGCARGSDAPAPRFTEDPVLSAPPDVPLARELVVRTDRPTRLALRVDDGDVTEVAFPALAEEHVVPVLGLRPDRDVVVTVSVASEYGGVGERELSFRTDPLPDDLPTIEVLTVDPARVEPGLRICALSRPDGPFWTVALRAEDGEVGWLYTGEINFGDLRPTAQGTLLGLWGSAWEMDWLGRVVRRWARPSNADPGDIVLPWDSSLTHEVFPLPDGTYASMIFDDFPSPSYPSSYEDPTPSRPATIQQQRVVRFDAAGNGLADLPLAERLDPSRIGFDSLLVEELGYDWSHANAVLPWGDDGSLLVSVRHQDAVLKLDPAGEVEWILGTPSGWDAPWSDLLLTPTPGLSWQYHQHGPALDAEGRVVLFDNHNDGHTPYDPPPADVRGSRVVAFEVDEAARTVSQAWEWYPPVELASDALGNAQPLPLTGNVLADFGFLDGEGGVLNEERGWGRKSARLVELVPGEAEPVWDVRVTTPRDEADEGVKCYRLAHVPSLWPPDAVVR